MGAVKEDAIMEGLRTLVPISALPDDKFKQLADTLQIEQLGSGKELFQEGDTDQRAVYLLSGKVVMLSGKSIVDTIVGGTDHARYPLAHHIPRQLTARSKSKVSFVRIDTQVLDRLLTGDTSNRSDTYEVSEVLEDDDDWMAQLLQAEALANLPPENIQAMFMQLEEVPLKAGREVVREGEQGEYFYMVRSGKAKVVAKDSSGKAKVVAELGPGDSFGEEALISGGKRNATVTMLTDGILMRLEQENFDRLMKDPLINWVTYDEATDIVKDGGTWLDVRLPNEHSKVSIAGSKNLPLSVLRNNLDRLESNTKYVTYCDNGKRSSVAAFLLSQRGLEAYVLAGGYNEPDRAPDIEEAPKEASKEVLDFNKSQIEARKKAEEEVVRIDQQRSDAETRAESESRKRAELEQELANMKAEQERARQKAKDEVNKRLDAEKAVAQMKKEQENAFKKAQEEIKKRQEAEKEAARIKVEAEKARKKAEAEAAKLKAEREKVQAQSEKELEELKKQRENLRSQAFATAEKLREEAQAAREKAEAENVRLKKEAEAARLKAEEDTARLREEADAARRKAEQETERLAKEQEEVRRRAEADAARLKAEAEEIRRRAEIEARKRSEELASEIVAEAEAARIKAEQEAEQLMAEAESARLDAEAEHAKFLSSQQHARLQAEQEVARLQAEAEQLRLASEEEQRRMSEIEARRLAAEEEASRLRSEAESTRMAAEEEAQRRMSDAEAARLEAEEEAARIKAEAESARLRAEEEAQRLAAEVEQARMSDDATSDAQAMARLESEAEAARLEAEQAQRLKQEAEEKRKAAEQEAIRLKVEVEQARQAAEDEAQKLIKDAETSRKLAEKEAAKVSKQADKARKKAQAEADKLTAKAEKARKKAEADANRIQSEADEAHKKAEDMVARMRREAEELRARAVAAAAEKEAEEPPVVETAVTEPDLVDEIADELLNTEAEQARKNVAETKPEEMDEVDQAVAELAAAVEVVDIPDIAPEGDADESAVETIPDITEIAGSDDDDSDLIVLNDQVADPSSLLVTQETVEEDDDEISRLINATAEESDRSGFVVPENLRAQQRKTPAKGLLIGGGVAAVVVLALVLWLVLGGDEPVPQVVEQGQPEEPVIPESQAPEVIAEPAAQPVPEPVEPPVVADKPVVEPAPVEPVPVPEVTAPQPDPLELAKIEPQPEPVKASSFADFTPASFHDALKIGGQAPTMMKIPAGSFTMGSGTQSTNFDERPPRNIDMKPFNMSRHEVTVADYTRFLRATGRSTAAFRGKNGSLPASGISWVDAQQYVKWLSAQTGQVYRLPSEVEWEYAARAGSNSVFWWGNEVGEGKANCYDCNSDYDGKLAPVGKFQANVFGLYDMAGNVMEWTQDCVNPNYKGAPTDGSAWLRGNCKSRIARGGAYNTPSDTLRSRKRSDFEMTSELDNIGLRLVRE